MVKLLVKIVSRVLSTILLFFALYAIFCSFIPLLQSGATLWEAVKFIAVSLFNGVKALIGL